MTVRSTLDVTAIDIAIGSPQQAQAAVLKYAGEIRFGPPYYELWIHRDNVFVGPGPGTVFGACGAWSSDSSFLAVAMWNSLEHVDTSLLVIDVQLGVGAVLQQRSGWFIDAVEWDETQGPAVCASVVRYSDAGVEHAESAANPVGRLKWDPLPWWP